MKFKLIESLNESNIDLILVESEEEKIYRLSEELEDLIYDLKEKLEIEYPDIDFKSNFDDLDEIPYKLRIALSDALKSTESDIKLDRMKREEENESLSLEEDIEIPAVEMTPVEVDEIEPANPEPGVETGLAGVVMSLIKDEYDAIEGYNGAVATAKDNGYDDLVTIFESIASEELVHVGELQKALEIVSPNAAKIKEGEVEAEEHIGDDDINDDGTLDWGGTEAILKAVDPNGGIINEN